ncbi:MAG: DJ-1/PfpI family protein [Eubacteriales bacterium]|nr:DJ-1/PfpI family protein [Eubacteriales bacterium]
MGKKIGILLENRFIEREVFYYQSFFEAEGFEPVFLTRLWGQPRLTFKGLEYQAEASADHSFEELTDADLAEYAAVIVPAGYVADYLLYTEKPGDVSPAGLFLQRVMAKPEIIKGFICHSLWLAGPIKESFTGRRVTCHNNILSHVRNAGLEYIDQDVVVDGDLITARTGGHHGIFAKTILANLK